MKKLIKIIFSLVFILLMLTTPNLVKNGVNNGLILWYNGLVPALFPYMIVSNIIVMSGVAIDIAVIFRPIARFLKISPNAAYCIFSGLFFGYPSCAVNSILMVKEGYLDKESANLCVCAFNNVSPAFIIGFVCIGIYNKSEYILPFLLLFYISLLLSTVTIKLFLFKKLIPLENDYKQKKSTKSILSDSILLAIKNITLLAGYVVIFSISTEYIVYIRHTQSAMPFIEICNGVSKFNKNIPIVISALSFGGVSGIFQTFGVDSDGIICKKKYIYSKVISSVTCLVITYIAVYVLKIPI